MSLSLCPRFRSWNFLMSWQNIVSSSFWLITLAPMVFLDFLSNLVCIDFGGMFLNPMFVIPVTTLWKRCNFHFHILALIQTKLKGGIVSLIGKYFLNAECKIVLVNKLTVGSYFNYKDKLPAGMRASLVYKFSCAQCASTYIGSTGRMLRTRVAEHMLGGVIETRIKNTQVILFSLKINKQWRTMTEEDILISNT